MIAYPPLDTLKPVADGIYIVDSLLPGVVGKIFAARMTVIRLGDGTLLLHSPTRFQDILNQELNGIGQIRHLVAPDPAHWMFLPQWQDRYPTATTWAAPGLRSRSKPRKRGVRLDYDLGSAAPAEWGEDIELVMIPGGFGFHEAAVFHHPSRTLVLTDLVQNLEPGKLARPLRPLPRLLGIAPPMGGTPLHLRWVINLRRNEASAATHRLLDLEPERVLFAHGLWFRDNGTTALRSALRWLL